ncbi:MAG TPA: hypothetical protein VII76_05670 [Acidimicrobiales bacterium]
MSLDVDAFLDDLGADGRDVKALVRAWEARPTPGRLQNAFRAGGVELIDPFDAVVAMAALEEALLDLHIDAEVASTLPEAVLEDFSTEPGVLQIDPCLVDRRLPLIPLAEDIARGCGGLRIKARQSGRGAYCTVVRNLGASVVLEASYDDRAIGDSMSHELAHLLDPLWGRVAPVGMEDFAHALAPLLRTEEPATVQEAAPLVQQALEASDGRRSPRAPAAEGVRGIVELILLELAARRMPVPELAARHGGSGRQTRDRR